MARNSTKPKDDANPAVEAENVNVTPAPTTENPGVTNGPSGTPAPTQDEETFAGTHVVNTARGLNLRQRPSFGAEVLDVLPFGTAVQDVDPAGAPAGWLHVMTEDGKAGFVAERYVSPIEE